MKKCNWWGASWYLYHLLGPKPCSYMTCCFCLTQNWPRRTWFYKLTVLLRILEKLVRAKLALSALYISMTRQQNQKNMSKLQAVWLLSPYVRMQSRTQPNIFVRQWGLDFFKRQYILNRLEFWYDCLISATGVLKSITPQAQFFSNYNKNLRLILGLICKSTKLSFKSNYITWK